MAVWFATAKTVRCSTTVRKTAGHLGRHRLQLCRFRSFNFAAASGDTYAIHARGNTVAFAAFNDFADSFVSVSKDNGDGKSSC